MRSGRKNSSHLNCEKFVFWKLFLSSCPEKAFDSNASVSLSLLNQPHCWNCFKDFEFRLTEPSSVTWLIETLASKKSHFLKETSNIYISVESVYSRKKIWKDLFQRRLQNCYLSSHPRTAAKGEQFLLMRGSEKISLQIVIALSHSYVQNLCKLYNRNKRMKC